MTISDLWSFWQTWRHCRLPDWRTGPSAAFWSFSSSWVPNRRTSSNNTPESSADRWCRPTGPWASSSAVTATPARRISKGSSIAPERPRFHRWTDRKQKKNIRDWDSFHFGTEFAQRAIAYDLLVRFISTFSASFSNEVLKIFRYWGCPRPHVSAMAGSVFNCWLRSNK